MTERPVIDSVPLPAFFLLNCLAMMTAVEIGFRIGRWRFRKNTHDPEAPVGGKVAAELGLFAFLLAFTFGIAASRFDVRRQLLLDEVNSVGTLYLRSALLPDAQRDQTQALLRGYVDSRIAIAAGERPLGEGLAEAEKVHQRLWSGAVSLCRDNPNSLPVSLYVQSLNETIDLHTSRLMALLHGRIPWPVWVVLFVVAVSSFGSIGYQDGLAGRERSPMNWAVIPSFAIVIWLVADLDRPHQGWLRVTQQPMIELRRSMDELPGAAG